MFHLPAAFPVASGGSTLDLGERMKSRWKKVVASVEKAIEKVKRKKHAAQNDDNKKTGASTDTENLSNADVSNTSGNPNVSKDTEIPANADVSNAAGNAIVSDAAPVS